MKAILLDFDGTILDTESPQYESWKAVYADFAVDLPVELYARCIGSSHERFDPVQHLESETGKPIDWDAIHPRRRAHYRDLLEREEILPGITELLEQAGERGLKLAIASSSPRDWVLPLLEKHGLVDSFDAIVTLDDVSQPKPDPELFLLALERLAVERKEAIVIEDSPNGCEAAARAGIFCVFVPNLLTARLEVRHRHWRLDSLAQTTVVELEKRLGGNEDVG